MWPGSSVVHMPFLFIFRILHLYMGGIQQHDSGDIGSGAGAVNPVMESSLHQLR